MASRDQSNMVPIDCSCRRMLSMLAVGPLLGMDAAFDGCILRRESKRIEADRKHHVVPVHAQVAGARVGRGHGKPVPDMEVARGVGQHGQEVELLLLRVDLRSVQFILRPTRLPAGFNFLGVVAVNAVSIGRLDRGRILAQSPTLQTARRAFGAGGPSRQPERESNPRSFRPKKPFKGVECRSPNIPHTRSLLFTTHHAPPRHRSSNKTPFVNSGTKGPPRCHPACPPGAGRSTR